MFFKKYTPYSSNVKKDQLKLPFKDGAIADTIHLYDSPSRDDYGARALDNPPLKDSHIWSVHSQ